MRFSCLDLEQDMVCK